VLGLDATLDAMLHADDGTAAFGQEDCQELRFLYPFQAAHPQEVGPLWRFSYEGASSVPAPDATAFGAAVRAGDLASAERAAHGLVDAVYAMPPVPAAAHVDVLTDAVLVIELAPMLRTLPHDALAQALDAQAPPPGAPAPLAAAIAARRAHETHAALPAPAGNPLAASIEYWTFQEHLRTRIPDGWADAIRRNTPPATFRGLTAEADAWLARHPAHPLADLVRLAKVRIHHLAGDSDAAWDDALAVYPARRVRALAELRYLLLQGDQPRPPAGVHAHDLELEAAFLRLDALDAARWSDLWREAQAAEPSAVAINLEERLLVWAAGKVSPGVLPAAFPARPRAPTPLWAKLRAAALIRAHEWDRALEQLAMLPRDDERTRLEAVADLQSGRAERAAELPGLSGDARAYVLGVVLDEAAVRRLCASTERTVRLAACFDLAVRLSRAGKWDEALPFARAAVPEHAALWEQAARIAQSSAPDRDLALARFLDGHDGEVVAEYDSGLYRGASAVAEGMPATSPERARVAEWLMRANERWLAVEAYTRWLAHNESAPGARAALDEADRAYNRVINRSGGGGLFFEIGPRSTVAAELRRVGARVRHRS
jgi:hypothetical protein